MVKALDVIDAKDPGEIFPISLSFRKALAEAETITTVDAVTVTVDHGTDASPSALLNGLASIAADGKAVTQWIDSGLHGVTYKLKIRITTSTSRVLVGAALVPVRNR